MNESRFQATSETVRLFAVALIPGSLLIVTLCCFLIGWDGLLVGSLMTAALAIVLGIPFVAIALTADGACAAHDALSKYQTIRTLRKDPAAGQLSIGREDVQGRLSTPPERGTLSKT